MPPPAIRPGRVELQHQALGYSDRDDAHVGPGGEDIQLPAGEYVVRAWFRNEDQWHDQDLDDGWYYHLRGDEGSGYVRQNELIAAIRGRRAP